MIKFIHESASGSIEFTIEDETRWPDIADRFMGFLLSVGYSLDCDDLAWHYLTEDAIAELKDDIKTELGTSDE